MESIKNFSYSNVQKYRHGPNKTTHKVIVQKGRGHKIVSYYKKGKQVQTIKKKLHPSQIIMIKKKQFIPGLFKDCKCKTYKKRD
jgi:hypothetical protein